MGERFFLLQEIVGYFPLMSYIPMHAPEARKFLTAHGIRRSLSKIVTKYENGLCSFWLIKKEFDALSNEIIVRLLRNPQIGEQFNAEILKESSAFYASAKKLISLNLDRYSDKELYALFEESFENYRRFHNFHWIQTAMDFGDNLFSKRLLIYLKEKIDEKSFVLGDVFSTLTSPLKESNAGKEYKSLLKLLEYVVKHPRLRVYFAHTETRLIVEELKRLDARLYALFEKHRESYGYLGYGFAGPAWDMAYFVDIVASLIRQGARPSALFKKIVHNKEVLKKKQKFFVKKLSIDYLHQRLFGVARGLVYSKGIRKDSLFYYFSIVEHLHREIGRRFFLSLKQVRFLYPHEIKQLLLKHQFDSNRLNERISYSVCYSSLSKQLPLLLEEKKARIFLKQFELITYKYNDVKVLQGDCATSGRIRGRVAIINTPQEMEKMKQSNILVSMVTNPDLMPAIRKAAAIVTDAGGITCHAAIVSRELGIPCVVGTKIATKALRDGDLVDVNATHGKVTVIKRAKNKK
ncbi:MAG: hypothetical protein HY981_02915 [Candidatus Magasanikbacteria bacterium]|nr:hypothetical protein [Candidatus Magasanikbacteria bacterium]